MSVSKVIIPCGQYPQDPARLTMTGKFTSHADLYANLGVEIIISACYNQC